MDEEYEVLRAIAKRLGTTNQRLGQILNDTGFRNADGSPTQLAKQHGMTIAYRLSYGGTSMKWQVKKVIDLVRLLEIRHPGTLTPKKIRRVDPR